MNKPISLPADFPRGIPAGVPGVQPKLCVRLVDGKYVAGWTEDERQWRHAYCDDLVQQLVAYLERKASEHPDWTHAFNLNRIEVAMASKARSGEWDVTIEEQAWIVSRIQSLLGW